MGRDKGTNRNKGRWRVKQIRPLSIVLVIIMVVSILCGNILPDTAYADSVDPAQGELLTAEESGGTEIAETTGEAASADAESPATVTETGSENAGSGDGAAVSDESAAEAQGSGQSGENATEENTVPVTEYFEGTMTAEGSGYTVSVTVAKNAMIPEGSSVQVTEIQAGSQEYSDYLAGAENAVAQQNESIRADSANARLFDISIVTADGQKIEPNEYVNVSISYRDAMTVSSGAEMKAVHFGSSGTEVLDASENASGAGEGEKAVSGVSFETSGFSVYVIIPINPNEDADAVVRRTYTFVNADGTPYNFTLQQNPDGSDASGNAVTTNTEIVKNGDTLIDPGVPADPEGLGRQFQGWKVTASSTDAVPVDTMISFGTVSDINEDADADETVTLQAVFDESCRVVYHDEDGTAIRTDLVEEGTTIGTDAASGVSYTPYVSTYAFIGWSTTAYSGLDDANRPTDISEAITAVKNGEIHLYPVLMNCKWVRFETGSNASHVDSQAVTHGEKATAPENPTRDGYTFGGWYTEESGGTLYDFNAAVTEDLTLYAHWNAEVVNYTVVYWLQNANDDNYAVAAGGVVQKSGLTGATTNVTPSASDLTDASVLEGFHLKADPEQQIIRADGSTVVNVYYDRNIYKIYFYENGDEYTYDSAGDYYYFPGGYIRTGSWIRGYTYTFYAEGYYKNEEGPFANETGSTTYYIRSGRSYAARNIQISRYSKNEDNLIDELTIEARYGADISQLWPSARTGLSKTYSAIWKVERDGNIYQSNISTMPLGGDDFYSYTPSSNGEHIDYYLEALDGSYVLDHTDVVGSNMRTTDEDYYDIAGFTCDRNRSAAVGSSIGISGLRFYYTRNSYTITFMNGSTNLGTETYKYQADISGAGSSFAAQMEAQATDDLEFAGWYDNPEGYGDPYDFTGQTMPYSNMILYAHFAPKTHIAEVDYNGGESASPTYFQFEKGNNDQYPEISTTRDYIEDPEGDYYYVQIPYTGTGTDESGGYAGYVKKSEITQEQLSYCDTSVTYSYQEDAYVFAGWYWEGGAKDGQAVDLSEKLTGDCKIVAKWRRTGNYYLAYDRDGDGTIDSVGSEAYLDGAEATVGAAPEKIPEGKTFIGWELGDQLLKPSGICTIDSAATETYEGKQVMVLTAAFNSLDSTYIQYNYNADEAEGDTYVLTDIGEEVTDNIQRNLQMNANVTLSSGIGFTRTGYELVGWNDQPDGSGTTYTLGGMYAADDPEGNVLYAIWKPANKTLTISKEISGNMADSEEAFDFTLAVTSGEELTDLPEGAAKNEDGTYTFSLKGGESIAFTIPYGSAYTVTENKGTDSMYTTTVSVDDGEPVGLTETSGTITADTTVKFTNTFDMDVDTGVSRNMVPFVLMTLMAMAAAAVFIRTRRKK
jgi:uncharacterized repeat protein (TIGR02543 family)